MPFNSFQILYQKRINLNKMNKNWRQSFDVWPLKPQIDFANL